MEDALMRYVSLFFRFLRFGLFAWGGPVAQIDMIRNELVQREGWIDSKKFTKILAVYQALPGPEATELCIYFGMLKGGRLGGFLAGLGFILPGLCLMLALSWAFITHGAAVLTLFAGIAPAVAALILRGAYRISRSTLYESSLWAAWVLSIILTLSGVHFLIVFAVCAVWQALWAKKLPHVAILFLSIVTTVILADHWFWGEKLLQINTRVASEGGSNLFREGLRAGLFTFGGAYTAIPMLKEHMVGIYSGITTQTFLDGIALCNMIPAPLVFFATHIGYVSNGFSGALLITLGILLPAFAITLIAFHQLEKIIETPALSGLLEGTGAGVVGLLTITSIEIIHHAVTDSWLAGIFVVSLAILFYFKGRWVPPAVIASSGLAGYIHHFLTTQFF